MSFSDLGIGIGPTFGQGVGGDPVLAAFADGTDGFYFDFSKTDRLFQDTVDTPSDDDGEPIGLALEQHSWAGRSLASILASAANLAPASSSISGFTLVNCTLAVVSGEIELTATATGVTFADVDVPVTNGQFYRWEATMRRGQAAGAAYISPAYGAVPYSTAVQQETNKAAAIYKRASGTSTEILRLRFDATAIGQKAYFSGFKCQAVPGNHALQATTTKRPLYKTNSGKPYLSFDGSDDVLQSSFAPTAAMTMAIAFNSATDGGILMGGGNSTGNFRAYVAAVSGGKFAAGWGAQSSAVIQGGSGALNSDHVGLMTVDATSVDLWLDGALVYSQPPSGTGSGGGGVPTVAIGGWNNGGTPSTWSAMRAYAALALNRRVTPAEIASITSLFQRTYQ